MDVCVKKREGKRERERERGRERERERERDAEVLNIITHAFLLSSIIVG